MSGTIKCPHCDGAMKHQHNILYKVMYICEASNGAHYIEMTRTHANPPYVIINSSWAFLPTTNLRNGDKVRIQDGVLEPVEETQA